MGNPQSIGKVIALIGILSAYLVLSGSGGVTGWDAFVVQMTSNPFADWPGFPIFEPPTTADEPNGTLYLRNVFNGEDDCELEDGLLHLQQGTLTQNTTLPPDGSKACFVYGRSTSFREETYNSGEWTIDLWLSQTGSGAQYDVVMQTVTCGFAFCWVEDDTIFSSLDRTDMGSPVSIQFSHDSFTGVIRLFIRRDPGGTGNLVLSYNNGTFPSRIIPPGFGNRGCEWWDVVCHLDDVVDWAGAAILFIGGTFWTAISGFFRVLEWLATTIFAFFSAIFGMLAFLAGGAGAPSPVSYIFQVVFIGLIAMTFFSMFQLVRGGA